MTYRATAGDAGSRLDQFLARSLPQASRAKIQRWIEAGCVRVNGETAKPSARLRGNEQITIDVEEAQALAPTALARAFAEEIPLDVLFEDEQVVAINKPAGMTVHAGAGVTKGTLVNALLHHFRQLSSVGGELRPGIVHRLDRFTSGVLLVAKTDAAHVNLARQFASRQVRKTYWALVHRSMTLARPSRASLLSQAPHANAHHYEARSEAPIPSRDREGAVVKSRAGHHPGAQSAERALWQRV